MSQAGRAPTHAVTAVDERGRVRRVAELGAAAGELRSLEQRDVRGRRVWEVRYSDYAEIGGVAFAQELALRSPSAEARLLLRGVELNPGLPEGLFQVAP